MLQFYLSDSPSHPAVEDWTSDNMALSCPLGLNHSSKLDGNSFSATMYSKYFPQASLGTGTIWQHNQRYQK